MKKIYLFSFITLLSLAAVAKPARFSNNDGSALSKNRLQEGSTTNTHTYYTIAFNTISTSNGYVNLKWTVENETEDCTIYEIERKIGTGGFKTVAYVLPNVPGNKMPYLFKEKVKSEQVYYRIKQVFKNGKVSYSAVKASYEEDKPINNLIN